MLSFPVVGALIRAIHARSKRPDLIRARQVSSLSGDDPPAHAGAKKARHMQGLVGTSTTPSRWRCPLPSGPAHAMAMLSEEGEFPLGARPGPAHGAAEGLRSADQLVDATGIVTEDPRFFSNHPGATAWSDTVSRCSPATRSATSVSGDRVSRKVHVGARSRSDDPDLGACSPDVCDFACKRAFSVSLPLPACGRIEGQHRLPSSVVDPSRAAGGLDAGGPARPPRRVSAAP